MSTTRKVFNFDNFNEYAIVPSNKLGFYNNTISACGCLFKNKNKLLLIKYDDPNWSYLDDFGGQVDNDDKTPYDTIIREASEETNEQISTNIIKKLLKNNKYNTFYNNKSKYFCVVFEVTDDFFKDTSIFGTTEYADNIKRTINWYTIDEAKKNLCNRLRYNVNFMKFLEQ